MGKSAKFLIVSGLVFFSFSAFADEAPECLSYGKPLAENNQQVLHWKRTTDNQFRERAHIVGTILNPLPDKNGHNHVIVQIGSHDDDTIELIYNTDFGAIPELKQGMSVEACGDYITSTAQSGPYPPSPVGGIIHWVHKNPSGKGHDSGYTMIDGVLYGQDTEHAGGKGFPNQHGGKKHHGGGGNDYPQFDSTDLGAQYETSLDAANQR